MVGRKTTVYIDESLFRWSGESDLRPEPVRGTSLDEETRDNDLSRVYRYMKTLYHSRLNREDVGTGNPVTYGHKGFVNGMLRGWGLQWTVRGVGGSDYIRRLTKEKEKRESVVRNKIHK